MKEIVNYKSVDSPLSVTAGHCGYSFVDESDSIRYCNKPGTIAYNGKCCSDHMTSLDVSRKSNRESKGFGDSFADSVPLRIKNNVIRAEADNHLTDSQALIALHTGLLREDLELLNANGSAFLFSKMLEISNQLYKVEDQLSDAYYIPEYVGTELVSDGIKEWEDKKHLDNIDGLVTDEDAYWGNRSNFKKSDLEKNEFGSKKRSVYGLDLKGAAIVRLLNTRQTLLDKLRCICTDGDTENKQRASIKDTTNIIKELQRIQFEKEMKLSETVELSSVQEDYRRVFSIIKNVLMPDLGTQYPEVFNEIGRQIGQAVKGMVD
jgi:hypothetical protein